MCRWIWGSYLKLPFASSLGVVSVGITQFAYVEVTGPFYCAHHKLSLIVYLSDCLPLESSQRDSEYATNCFGLVSQVLKLTRLKSPWSLGKVHLAILGVCSLVMNRPITRYVTVIYLKILLVITISKFVFFSNPLGPEMKFKGIFYPVIISPDGIVELTVMNYASNGEFLQSLFS